MRGKSMMKRMACVLASVLLAFAMMVAGGCAPAEDNEALIRQDLSSQLNQMKNLDDETVDTLVDLVNMSMGSQAAALETVGISVRDIVDAVLNGFDYQIESIAVDGDEATAQVVITSRDISQFYTSIAEYMSDIQTNPEQFAGMTQDQIYEALGDKVKEALAALPLTESDVDLDYEKEEGVWNMTSASSLQLSKAFFS